MGALDEALDLTAAGAFQFLSVVGEPGVGKTRLLSEMARIAARQGFVTRWGRAAEFEQELPFGVVTDALDDHLEACRHWVPDRLGVASARLLRVVFPSLAAGWPDALTFEPGEGISGLVRHRLYRAVRQLLAELATPPGLVLILDDMHWADSATLELLEHVVRHPPRGPVLVAVTYRLAQAQPQLVDLIDIAAGHGRLISVDPFSQAEAAEFLGSSTSRARCRELYKASGGNPFYLEALARMGARDEPMAGGDGDDDLPPMVRAALQQELRGLSPTTLLVAQAAAVAADQFEPALAAVAGEVSEGDVLEALNVLVTRDIVRPVGPGGRFRFRHPLIRHATYASAEAGWRLAAHARIAAHLAGLDAPAILRAHHVGRSGRFGDQGAIRTLVNAARGVAAQAPATAAHWLNAALELMPVRPKALDDRPRLLVELARLQMMSGRLLDGREIAREALRRLPTDDYAERARVARYCAVMERLLDRPDESRALLLAELRKMPDPQSVAAVPLRLRLVADSMLRLDFRAAQAVLDRIPESSNDIDHEGAANRVTQGIPVAVAAMRPVAALGAGRITDAVRYVEVADRLLAATSDDHLAEWLDAIAWLCWTETMMGRYRSALEHFDRAAAVARSGGQIHSLTNLLAGQARAYSMLGRLAEAGYAAEEAAEIARLMSSGQALAFALAQQCLASSWSGADETALRLGDEAVHAAADTSEWWGALAKQTRAIALINAGQLDAGAEAMLDACNGFNNSKLDPSSLLSCCEAMAYVETARGHPSAATMWADRAREAAHPELEINNGLAQLARAHALRKLEPVAAAEHAQQAAGILAESEQRVDAGRARLHAGVSYADAGERRRARTELQIAAETFAACGARTLHAQTAREQRRLGVRVSYPTKRSAGPGGLSRREQEVAALAAEGYSNQQIAGKLVVSLKTVESHLSHIFTKLDVTSRVGMVNALDRRNESDIAI